jgi:hypothetical protein
LENGIEQFEDLPSQ